MLSLASFGVDRVKRSLKVDANCSKSVGERQAMNYEDIRLILYSLNNWSMKSYQYWLRLPCKILDAHWLIGVG